jgi:hypothetical protein
MAAEKRRNVSPARGTHSIFFSCVRQKGRNTDKSPECPDIASYRPQHAGPGSDTELSPVLWRQIGNHLKNPRRKFRIVNHSFTSGMELLACNKTEK